MEVKQSLRVQNRQQHHHHPPHSYIRTTDGKQRHKLFINDEVIRKMKQKHIEYSLSSVTREFPDPKVGKNAKKSMYDVLKSPNLWPFHPVLKIHLEQYPTSAELVASIVSFARNEGDLGPGRTAIDLGCGTGMLALGCALVECDAIIGIDCDEDALAVARTNAQELETSAIDFILAKISTEGFIVKRGQAVNSRVQRGRGRSGRGGRGQPSAPSSRTVTVLDPGAPDGLPLQNKCVDTVVTNPPFGTKHNAGMDVRFLKAATRLARRAVYSFHKTSTRDYLLKLITQEWKLEARVVAELRFDIPKMYRFHNEKSVDIKVDLLRVQIGCEEEDSGEEANVRCLGGEGQVEHGKEKQDQEDDS
jgi:putative methylase